MYHVTQNLPGCVDPELTESYPDGEMGAALDDFMQRVIEAYEALEEYDLAADFGSPSNRQDMEKDLRHPFWRTVSTMVDNVIYSVQYVDDVV